MTMRSSSTEGSAMDRQHVGGQTTRRGDFAADVNVGDTERLVSAAAGVALLLYGVARGALGGWALAGLGAALSYRGFTGHSWMYRALGIDRSSEGPDQRQGNLGIRLARTVTVDAPVERVYGVWRRLANLPRFMSHLERVEEIAGGRSRWTVRAPAGVRITWDAEIINDVPNRLIAWRTVDTQLVAHAGSVNFDRTPDGRGTVVRVSMQYAPPAGELGQSIAAVLGTDPRRQLEEDLATFKRAMEAGELAA